MNALLKKEIRLLLPSFLIGCALTLANLFFQHSAGDWFNSVWYFLSFVFCPAVAVMIALDSFGGEVNSGTFAMLLAQPVSRLKIWQTKISLLAFALLTVGFLWCLFFVFHWKYFGNKTNFENPLDVLTSAFMFGLVVFSGGLWTVLLLRQVAAAFWFTLLVPGMILVILVGLLAGHSDEFIEGMVVSVLGFYSLAGFFFARWLFFRAQDVQWSGGTIVMPEMRGLPAWLSRSSVKRIFRPRAALWRKEIQLHQSQFVMAFALLLLHLGVLATRTFGHFRKNSSTEFILEAFWGLWLVMPVLVGCAAVAEERKLGTLEGQLCLPVKRRTQFAIKFSIALFLSVFLGVVMPLLLEGTRILPNNHFEIGGLESGWQNYFSVAQIFTVNCLETFMALLPLLTLFGIAAAFGMISFYVSSLTRNTLQSLAPAVLGLVLGTFLMLAINGSNFFNVHFPWRGWLIYFIGVPVFLIVLVALSFGNFKRVNIGGKVWLQNAFVFAAALAFVVVTTSAIYHRAWEKLTPFEPSHGAARLSLSNPPTLSEQWNTLAVRLPDGKIWTDNYTLNIGVPNPLALLLGDIRLTSFGGGHFLDGSNWVSVLRGVSSEFAGLKTDGTLWVSENPPRRERLANGKWKMIKAGDLVQFDSETNWNSIVPTGLSMLLVKNNGTLWRWGGTNWNWKNEWPGLRSFTPQRLGTESNWAEVFLSNYQPCLRKTDGSVWMQWFDDQDKEAEKIEIEPGLRFGRMTSLENRAWRSTTDMRYGLESRVGVSSDGTFRVWSTEQLNTKKNSQRYNFFEQVATDLQFGKDTNWLGVAGRGEKVVTLKNDGSLWLWNFYHDNSRGWDTGRDEREMLDAKPVRLGTHADWIAIASTDGGIISLAADGSLWYWPLESASYMAEINGTRYFDNGNSHFEPLLDISHKPQFLGNIFGNTD